MEACPGTVSVCKGQAGLSLVLLVVCRHGICHYQWPSSGVPCCTWTCWTRWGHKVNGTLPRNGECVCKGQAGLSLVLVLCHCIYYQGPTWLYLDNRPDMTIAVDWELKKPIVYLSTWTYWAPWGQWNLAQER